MPSKATKKSMVEVPMTVVIPTGQYANIQPTVTGVGSTFEEARNDALQKAESFYSSIEAQADFKLNSVASALASIPREKVKCYATGVTAYFDPVGHTYIDAQGNQYVSGSVFAGQFEHEFNKAMILPKYAKKCNVDESLIEEMWQSKANASTTFGTALHQALETYGKYKDLCDLIGKDIGIHPTLLPIVEAFFDGREDEQAVYEPFVADTKNMRCGFIDRLVVTGKKRCRIQDYKTNADLYKKGTPANLKAPYSFLPNIPLGRYMIQLSFYKAIMEAAGWTVEGLDVMWWNGIEWKTIEIKPVEIDVPQGKIDLSLIS
jgi:hypothetical protein